MNPRPWSPGTLLAVLLAVVLNASLAWATHAMAFPLFFDSVFTFAVVWRHGWPAGSAVALGTNALLQGLSVVPFPFVVCHLLTVAGAWLVFRRRDLSLPLFLGAGLVSAVTNGAVGSLLSYFVFQGVTAVNPIDNLVLGLVVTGQSMGGAVFWGGMVTNLVDKLLSAGAAFFLCYRMSPSFLAKAKSS